MHRLSDWIRKQESVICCLEKLPSNIKTQVKSKVMDLITVMKKYILCLPDPKKAKMA